MVKEVEIVRVRKETESKRLASAVVNSVRKGKVPQLMAVGAAALHKAMVALAIARGILLSEGVAIAITPHFKKVSMPDGDIRTALVLTVVAAPVVGGEL